MELIKTKDGTTVNLNFAQNIVEKNLKPNQNKRSYEKYSLFNGLSTSKLRNLMEQVNRLYTIAFNLNEEELPESFIDELEYLKVKFYYEAGREKSVNKFIDETYMLEIIDKIIEKRSKKYFLDYCKYFEALVAFSKYYKKEDEK
ncbi:type III-A CRISPR-associated protein Csm2 [Mammaliicoccus sciuri]|uniref:type III-A CRISPR-associated protein Csm2 n=1 Tax=Mammaliicoccus sciuri TaxID=1296 RepID=UPI000D1ECEB1|nr:type III-A CRISPR-associated protein Csm2 [Mammaliicoccus sciuri]MEB7816243.1 type III-A CRISPR-associated protein Csm2 [Mammaliicoccus sciuri]PTJ44491.1 type III-A CRISPR-associated protein Csm2 [Mammaliicoccus sciuri]